MEIRTTTTAASAAAAAAATTTADGVLGECSLNLVEVVSGRAPHIEEWVPLDRGGDLRLSLDYDSVGGMPVPGDSVRTMTTDNENVVLGVATLPFLFLSCPRLAFR